MSEGAVVLLVDDEPRMLSALSRTLRREGHVLETAADASRALERLAASPPVALVISDHKMPGMTGVELLAEVARRWPGTARILLSGWVAEIPQTALARADVSALLSKPWDDAELKRVIREAIGDGR